MSDAILNFSDEDFNTEVLNSDKPVLVDFWAEWCGACKMITPVLEEVAGDYSEKMKIGKINVDDSKDIAVNYGIMSIPTLIIFKNGEEAERIVGYASKDDLKKTLDKYV